MTVRLEHANLLVNDIDGMIRFLQTAFPEFRIRREGTTGEHGRWIHIGTDDTYIALNEAWKDTAEQWVPYDGKPGLNHLGYEVEDVEALQARMRAAGYKDSTVANDHRSLSKESSPFLVRRMVEARIGEFMCVVQRGLELDY